MILRGTLRTTVCLYIDYMHHYVAYNAYCTYVRRAVLTQQERRTAISYVIFLFGSVSYPKHMTSKRGERKQAI